MRTIRGPIELAAAVGEELGVTDWHAVEQERIDAFAEVTGDHFWLHTDPTRAGQSPFGGTIAHGLYTLSLEPMFRYSLVTFEGWEVMVNYGYGKVRFPAPVLVGTRLRMRSTLTAVNEVDHGIDVHLLQVMEREGEDRPGCLAEAILRFIT